MKSDFGRIYLEDFLKPGVFYEPGRASPLIAEEIAMGDFVQAGYSQVRKIGLRRRNLTQISFFVAEREAILMIGENVFPIKSFQFKRRYQFPFVRIFEVFQGGQLALSFKYYFFFDNTWPHTNDLLKYFIETLNNPGQIRRMECLWYLKSLGVDTSTGSGQEQLDALVEASSTEEGPF